MLDPSKLKFLTLRANSGKRMRTDSQFDYVTHRPVKTSSVICLRERSTSIDSFVCVKCPMWTLGAILQRRLALI
jgi:hypothetical protein